MPRRKLPPYRVVINGLGNEEASSLRDAKRRVRAALSGQVIYTKPMSNFGAWPGWTIAAFVVDTHAAPPVVLAARIQY